MTSRAYTGPAFVEAMANHARTPILMIQTEGSGASSLRYEDITGVPEQVKDDLKRDAIAFVTFSNQREADQAFETLMTNWPEEGRTTLGITALLAVPGQRSRVFDAIPGNERSFRLAA